MSLLNISGVRDQFSISTTLYFSKRLNDHYFGINNIMMSESEANIVRGEKNKENKLKLVLATISGSKQLRNKKIRQKIKREIKGLVESRRYISRSNTHLKIIFVPFDRGEI